MSNRRLGPTSVLCTALCAVVAPTLGAQGSMHALRFVGGSPPGQDRAIIAVDDDVPGLSGNTPADIGAGSFTIEFWIRGALAANSAASGIGDVEYAAQNWKSCTVLVDREIAGSSGAEFGIGVAGGRIRFGTGIGAAAPFDIEHTLEGSTLVLDGSWHHVACLRDAESGRKRIYVDGKLDFASAPVSFADLSYPDAGGLASGAVARLVIGADGHDAGAPDFAGELDELRLWSKALSVSQILSRFDRAMPSAPSGLAAWYRFEEGAGPNAGATASPGAPSALVVAGNPQNGEWTSFANDPSSCAPISAGVLPPGFQRTVITEDLVQPTALAFLPDGRVLVTERLGKVRLVSGGVASSTPVVTLPVDTQFGERGVLGLAVHPQFANNGWFYVFYTTTEPRDRVARFTLVGTTASLSSEVVIWQAPALASNFHHAGGLGFDATGRLLIAVGDQLNSANAQDLAQPFGKLLRVGDDGSIPGDNPFVGAPGVAPEVFASGLRNPFRLSVDSDGTIYVGDVGGNTTLSAEEVNVVVAGADYGWPKQEGAECYVGDCGGVTAPLWSYTHSDPDSYLLFPQGSITMGPRYRATAFPSAYQGNLFVGEYANRSIRRLVFDSHGEVVADPVFLWPGFGRTIVDLDVGPDGALWYLGYGVSYGGIPDQAGLLRIAWIGGTNAAPVVSAVAAPAGGPAPLVVNFSSAGTLDPDALPAPLSYSWSFGDGAFSSAPNPTHLYASAGEYVAHLSVTDGSATTVSSALTIEVGNKPVPVLTAPVAGQRYSAGQTVAFSGFGNDLEDGALATSALSFEVLLVHADHVHPFLGPIVGTSGGSFVVPSTGHSPANTHFVVRLSATDSDGLSASTQVEIFPDPSALAFATLPTGIALELDGEPVVSPFVTPTQDGFEHVITAPLAVSQGGATYAFRCWSDGGPVSHIVVAPEGGQNVTAVYDAVVPNESTVVVPGNDRNAQHQSASGVVFASPHDPAALCIGRDSSDGIETGFQFVSPVPVGGVVREAYLEVTGTGQGTGQPACRIRAYDVASAPSFVSGSATKLTQFAPQTTANLVWTVPSIAADQMVSSPNLAALVQEVVDRPDYVSGSVFGLVLDGHLNTLPHHWCVRRFGSPQAPRLRVRYVMPNPTGGCVVPCGFSTLVPGDKPANHLALVGGGSTALGDLATVEASGLGSVGSATLFVSTTAGTTNFLGGTLLVGFGGFFGVYALPVASGATALPIPVDSNPAFVGFSLFFQVAAADPAQTSGVAFSNGLRFTICP